MYEIEDSSTPCSSRTPTRVLLRNGVIMFAAASRDALNPAVSHLAVEVRVEEEAFLPLQITRLHSTLLPFRHHVEVHADNLHLWSRAEQRVTLVQT
jgi:hypothetical protein